VRSTRRTAEFNEPALVRPQPLYILFRVKQGPVFLINSRQGNFRCGPPEGGQALSRSYGRLFAEFLWELSPVGLGTLTPAHLCRFCGTGCIPFTLWGFSRLDFQPSSPKIGFPPVPRLNTSEQATRIQ